MFFSDATQRAYTLKLKGPRDDSSWKKVLWKTHETVNAGAKAFGDFWLTLRGGLPSDLAKNESNETERRILITLGWLTVESPADSVPEKYVIATGKETSEQRSQSVLEALRKILQKSSVKDIEGWINDCKDSLSSTIREDAVWVNRFQIFLDKNKKFGWTQKEAQSVFLDMFGGDESYFKSSDGNPAEAKDFVQKAGNWLSTHWGSGEKSDTKSIVDKLTDIKTMNFKKLVGKPSSEILAQIIKFWKPESTPKRETFLSSVCELIGWKGSPSAGKKMLEKLDKDISITAELLDEIKTKMQKEIEDKQKKLGKAAIPWAGKLKEEMEQVIGIPFRKTRDHQKEFAVLMDHALRRVSGCHSWVKRAEASRKEFEADSNIQIDKKINEWLESYITERTISSGSEEEYFIRKNAIDCWEEIVKSWAQLGKDATPEQRVQASRDLQEEVEKFGDIQLFEALASAEPESIWLRHGKPDHQLFKKEILRRIAVHNKTRFKVPAYRHPDPLLHPVYTDFGNSRWAIEYGAQDRHSSENIKEIILGLWNGIEMVKTGLFWQSKRFENEIASCSKNQEGKLVSRKHIHALANGNAGEQDKVILKDLFSLKEWNGRLQADRGELEKIASLRLTNEEKYRKRLDSIKWFLTFSVPLYPNGPWLDYVSHSGYLRNNKPDGKPNKPLTKLAPRNDMDEVRGLAFPLDHPENDGLRKGSARFQLSRLDGLRIMSLDLGHRHSAAAAVWETFSTKNCLQKFPWIKKDMLKPKEMFLHLEHKGKKYIFRRIGDDKLPDGKEHPAPWALLDRQFMIKLAGEENESRYATDLERAKVVELENWLGYKSLAPRKPKAWKMDILLADIVRILRLGLFRHARRSRIAHGLVATNQTIPGGRDVPFSSDEERINHLADLLVDLHGMLTSKSWNETEGLKKWKEISSGILSEEDNQLTDESRGRKKADKTLAEKIHRLAIRFSADKSLCKNLSDDLADRWNHDDGEWKSWIKWVSRLLMPRKAADPKLIRQKGGLSLLRLSTIEDFRRKVQHAFFSRRKPDNTRLIAGENFGSKALEVLERLRENRVRQIASFIVSSALGIPKSKESKFHQPCHAIVIENLTNYRPEVSQTRRENRQLMKWSSGKIKKLLSEACQLAGIHLRHVSPAFTSRQDSRTGSPGSRCVEIYSENLKDQRWKFLEDKCKEKLAKGNAKPTDHYFLAIMDKCRLGKLPKTVLVPQKGGDLFVSSHEQGPLGIQADLNAAANIGLAALLDPEWVGRWWFVLADRKEHKPDVPGCKLFEQIKKLNVEESGELTKSKGKGRFDSSRHFRDASFESPDKGFWYESFSKYEEHFERTVISRLERKYGVSEETPF